MDDRRGNWCVSVGLPAGPVCGSGMLIDQSHVLTCAHSVPGGWSTPYGVSVGFPTPRGTESRRARVVEWFAPSAENPVDIAVLRIDGLLPQGAKPAPTGPRPNPLRGGDLTLRQFLHGTRTVETRAKASDGAFPAPGLLRLDVPTGETRPPIGYCGAGVVDAPTDTVIGMVVAEERVGSTRSVKMIHVELVTRDSLPKGQWPAPPTRASLRTVRVLELAVAIADLPSMSGQYNRDHVIGMLPRNIANAVPRNPEPRFDVLGILRTCLAYPNGLEEFIGLLRGIEGDSAQMRQMESILKDMPEFGQR